MRRGIAAASVALLFAAGSASAGTPNIAGVWHVQGQINYGPRFLSATPTCTFRQARGKLSGECVGPNARGPLSGLIAGDSVSWTWSHGATTGVGVSANTSFNGTYVNAHLISGRVSSSAMPGEGPFTQTR
jgi:hypothetical protein